MHLASAVRYPVPAYLNTCVRVPKQLPQSIGTALKIPAHPRPAPPRSALQLAALRSHATVCPRQRSHELCCVSLGSPLPAPVLSQPRCCSHRLQYMPYSPCPISALCPALCPAPAPVPPCPRRHPRPHSRPLRSALFSPAATLLFALPAVRAVQPGVPDVGAVIDIVGFFWNMALLALTSCWLLAAIYVRRREVQQHQQEEQERRQQQEQQQQHHSSIDIRAAAAAEPEGAYA